MKRHEIVKARILELRQEGLGIRAIWQKLRDDGVRDRKGIYMSQVRIKAIIDKQEILTRFDVTPERSKQTIAYFEVIDMLLKAGYPSKTIDTVAEILNGIK